MKRIALIFIIVFVLIFIGLGYFFYAPGVLTQYTPLDWKNIHVDIPGNFKVRTYRSKDWDVYSLSKWFFLVKIGVKPQIDIQRLPEFSRRVLFRSSPDPDSIYFISFLHKDAYEVVFACSREGTSVYLSALAPTAFGAVSIMKRMTASFSFNGQKIPFPNPPVPLKVYLHDIIILAALIFPLLILILVFSISGRIPNSEYFFNDPVLYSEKYVYYTLVRSWSRSSACCFFALTSSRLRIFTFGRPKWDISLRDDKQVITIERKRIRVQNDKFTLLLYPSRMDKLNDYLKGLV